ncbi:MAG: deoxyribonuclease IV [Phycisphaerales bacterium JB043]
MFGSHLSIAGGMVNALNEAESLTLDTVQVFTKNQRQWRITPLKHEDREQWLEKLGQLGWQHRTVAHDSYLINLASPDDELWNKSIDLMHEELTRAEALSIRYLVSHPGAYTSSSPEEGIRRIALAYKQLFDDIPFSESSSPILCLENTAGGGSTLGRTLEELAEIRSLIIEESGQSASNRVGYCLDTCHAFAAGYDIRTDEGARSFLDEADRVLGLSNVRVLHLNDSQGDLGSHRDRHAHISKGLIGLEGFAPFVNDPRLSQTPKILETPKGTTDKGTPYDTLNLRRLRRLMR